jgi:hypothetical protein
MATKPKSKSAVDAEAVKKTAAEAKAPAKKTVAKPAAKVEKTEEVISLVASCRVWPD